MKKKFLLTIATSIVLLLSGCGASNGSGDKTSSANGKKTIKAATIGSPAPFIIVEEDGSISGYDIKVIKEIFNRLPQYDLEIVKTDIDSVFTGVQSGLYDIGVNNWTYSEERAKTYLYSYPYDNISYVFLTKDGSIKSFADAAGKSFHGLAGFDVTTAVETWNEKNPDKKINIGYIEAGTNLAQEIYEGKTEFTILEKAIAQEYEKNYKYGLKMVDVPQDEAKSIAENSGAYFLFSKENDSLRQEVNKVIKQLREEGVLTKYSKEVFGYDAAPKAEQLEKTIN